MIILFYRNRKTAKSYILTLLAPVARMSCHVRILGAVTAMSAFIVT